MKSIWHLGNLFKDNSDAHRNNCSRSGSSIHFVYLSMFALKNMHAFRRQLYGTQTWHTRMQVGLEAVCVSAARGAVRFRRVLQPASRCHFPGLQCLRAPRRSRQKLILIAGTVHCWLVERLRAVAGPACHRLIDKALSVLGAAGPKHWRAFAILTRSPPSLEEFWGKAPLKRDLLNLPLGDAGLSTQ